MTLDISYWGRDALVACDASAGQQKRVGVECICKAKGSGCLATLADKYRATTGTFRSEIPSSLPSQAQLSVGQPFFLPLSTASQIDDPTGSPIWLQVPMKSFTPLGLAAA